MSTLNNPVGWFELYVSDMARARAFYKAVFERELAELPTPPGSKLQMYAFEQDAYVKGAAGALVLSPDMKPGSGGTLIYFSCEDCAMQAARATAAGGLVCRPKSRMGEYGFISIVRDTEGNSIGLHSRQ